MPHTLVVTVPASSTLTILTLAYWAQGMQSLLTHNSGNTQVLSQHPIEK